MCNEDQAELQVLRVPSRCFDFVYVHVFVHAYE
jgi:hypothetical protein